MKDAHRHRLGREERALDLASPFTCAARQAPQARLSRGRASSSKGRALLASLVALTLGGPAQAQAPRLPAGAMARVTQPEEAEAPPRAAKMLGPSVVIVGRRGDGDPPPRAAVDDLYVSIADGLVRSGARIIDAESVGVRPGTCMDGGCADRLREADVDYVLWAALSASDRDYTLDLRLERLDDPEEASSFVERCALCGLAEACERIEEGASGLLVPLAEVPEAAPRLLLTTEPSGARVVIDGEFVGRSPVDRVLSPGTHRVEASAAGYVATDYVVEAEPNRRFDVALNLAKVTPAPSPPPAPRLNGWIPIGIGVPTLAGGIVLAAVDGRPPLGCGSESGGCDGRLETIWPAAGMLVAGAALTTLGAVLVHQLRRSRRAKAAAKKGAPGASPATKKSPKKAEKTKAKKTKAEKSKTEKTKAEKTKAKAK